MPDPCRKSELVCRIRTRIIVGRLPPDPDALSFDAIGQGITCACCDRPIFNSQREVKLYKTADVVRYVAMHADCYEQWRGIATEMFLESLGPAGMNSPASQGGAGRPRRPEQPA